MIYVFACATCMGNDQCCVCRCSCDKLHPTIGKYSAELQYLYWTYDMSVVCDPCFYLYSVQGHFKGYVQCCVYNSVKMGQINLYAFQPHFAIDHCCIFLGIKHFQLSWVEYITRCEGIKTLIGIISSHIKAIDTIDIAVYLGTRQVTSCLCKVRPCNVDSVAQQEIYLLCSIYLMKGSQ